MLQGNLFADEPTYTKTASLPPLRITYQELQTVLDKCAKLMLSANSASTPGPYSATLRLKFGDAEIKIPGHQLENSGVKLPKLATEISYTASAVIRNTAPVATVSILFYDWDRRLTVEGQSPEQVDALFASVKSDLLAISSPMGGSMFRGIVGFIIFTICFLVAWYGFFTWLVTRQPRLIIPVLLACLGIAMLFVLPFDQFLAGFSVSHFDPSFASRYGSELSLLGVLLTVAGIPLSYFLPNRLSAPATSPMAAAVPRTESLRRTRRKQHAPEDKD
ncbi:MAG: hypothetical protein EXR70_10835 [Deltaproteobacteria bacterium]|nr:hypothetical protein [Deltaproteobacteria bacterium]